METHRYVIFGPQGSGKGTQAELLAAELNIPHIASGDLLRVEVARHTALGKRLADDINKGHLIPDKEAIALLTHELNRPEAIRGYVLDGFPRTLVQAYFLEEFAPPVRVIMLELNDEDAVKRLSGRRICSNCQTAYHLQYQPPKNEKKCDSCGGELITRADDSEAAVKARLAFYHSLTEPMADYYADLNKLIRLSALGTIYEVKVEIKKLLGIPRGV